MNTIHLKYSNLLKELGIKEPLDGMGLYYYLSSIEQRLDSAFCQDVINLNENGHFYSKTKRISDVWEVDFKREYYFMLAHSGEQGHIDFFIRQFKRFQVIYWNEKVKYEKFMITNLPKRLWDDTFNSDLVEHDLPF